MNMMNVLIVEDETAAYETLVKLLVETDPTVEIVGNTESITQTINWLQTNPSPDLILMDIHLSDGSAFTIFDEVQVETPVIFTTAYDEYAIKAFKVNSVDYLLKPVKAEELTAALAKCRKWTRTDIVQYLNNITGGMSVLVPRRDRMLLPFKDKLIPVSYDSVACFYTTDRNTAVYMNDGSVYPYSKSLEQIYALLNPTEFFRANKQFIISRNSIQDITIWFDNRLLVTLNVKSPERIYISKNKAAEFKTWMVNG
jgi:DNA-binding LytR/AlgR family response regulator